MKHKGKQKQAFVSSLILFIILLLLCPTYSELEQVKNISRSSLSAGDDDGVKKLKIAVPMRNGFKEFVNVVRDPQSNDTIVSGFSIDVFRAAIDSLTYPVPYEFIPFAIPSGQLSKSFDHLIHQVYLQEFDALVGDITITANRSLYVDFTLPYTDMGMGMIVPMQHKHSMWIFLKPLKPELWLTTAAFFVLTGYVIWIIERLVNDDFQGSRAQQIGTIFWFSFSTLVFAHREKLVSNLSKFIMMVWVFVVLILSSSYTATLTSMITVQQIKLESTLNSVGYQLGTSFAKDLTTNYLGYAESKLKPYESAEDYAIALSEGTKHGGVSAIFDEIPYIKAFLAKYSANHTLTRAPQITRNGFGFVFQKGSLLVHDISRAIAMLREEGKLAMIKYKWLHRHDLHQLKSMNQDSASNPDSLDLLKFGGLFLITGISSTLSLAIFLIISIYKKLML